MVSVTPGWAASSTPTEYDLKTALLYNFTQFVEWPESALGAGDRPLTIGIFGDDPFGPTLDGMVQGESVNGRKITVMRCRTVEAAREVQILFISANQKNEVERIVAAMGNRPVLTVADFDGFVQKGGMVYLHKTPANKIRLKINLDAARAANIVISAKLLRVADVVPPAKL